MEELTDESLMAAYINGDPAAFSQLFLRYAPALRRMMLKNRCSEDVANDLIQQTFLQLHRARLDYDGARPLRPWIFTIAINLLRGHFRGKARRPEADLDLADEPAIDPLGASRLMDAERRERVRAAVAQLPENQRVVIELHWFEDRSFKEIAAQLGANLSAVKVRAHRGYQRLKMLLEQSELEGSA